MPRELARRARPRRPRSKGAFFVVTAVVLASFGPSSFAAAAATTTETSSSAIAPSPGPFFPLGPPGDCSPAGVSMAVFPLSREEAEHCSAGGTAAEKKKECRVAKPTETAAAAAAESSSSAGTVFFSWSPLSESDPSTSNSTTTTTLLDTTGTPVKPARMPDALFSSSSGGSSGKVSLPASLSSPSPSPPPSPSSPRAPLPSSFALVSGRLLLEAAGNYTFYLSSDGLTAVEFVDEGRSSGGGNETAAAAAAAARAAAAPTLLSRSPKPLSLISPSPRAVDFSVSYVPEPAAASHFLALEWEFREGGGGGGGGGTERRGGGQEETATGSDRSQRSPPPPSSPSPPPPASSSSSVPKGNRRGIERGAVWPSALVGSKCQGPILANGGGRRRRRRGRSRRLLLG